MNFTKQKSTQKTTAFQQFKTERLTVPVLNNFVHTRSKHGSFDSMGSYLNKDEKPTITLNVPTQIGKTVPLFRTSASFKSKSPIKKQKLSSAAVSNNRKEDSSFFLAKTYTSTNIVHVNKKHWSSRIASKSNENLASTEALKKSKTPHMSSLEHFIAIRKNHRSPKPLCEGRSKKNLQKNSFTAKIQKTQIIQVIKPFNQPSMIARAALNSLTPKTFTSTSTSKRVRSQSKQQFQKKIQIKNLILKIKAYSQNPALVSQLCEELKELKSLLFEMQPHHTPITAESAFINNEESFQDQSNCFSNNLNFALTDKKSRRLDHYSDQSSKDYQIIVSGEQYVYDRTPQTLQTRSTTTENGLLDSNGTLPDQFNEYLNEELLPLMSCRKFGQGQLIDITNRQAKVQFNQIMQKHQKEDSDFEIDKENVYCNNNYDQCPTPF